MIQRTRTRACLAGAAAAVTALATTLVTTPAAQAAAGACSVTWQVTNDWAAAPPPTSRSPTPGPP